MASASEYCALNPTLDPETLQMQSRNRDLVPPAMISFIVLCGVAVGLRVAVRGWITKSFGFDDGFMCVAYVSGVLYLENISEQEEVPFLTRWYGANNSLDLSFSVPWSLLLCTSAMDMAGL